MNHKLLIKTIDSLVPERVVFPCGQKKGNRGAEKTSICKKKNVKPPLADVKGRFHSTLYNVELHGKIVLQAPH